MISINITLFIQLINFLILLFVLNEILFKPIMAKIREREALIEGDRTKATELSEQVERKESEHQAELARARQTAASEKSDLIAQAKRREAEILDKARNEASKIVEDMKAAIQTESEQVRSTLKAEMTPLAQSISEKILGRSVS